MNDYIDIKDLLCGEVRVGDVLDYIDTDYLLDELSERIKNYPEILDDLVNWYLKDEELKYLNNIISKELNNELEH